MIQIKNLLKKYENRVVVDNINIDIKDNEIFGLLGPNGAGKTTLIHLLATLIKPTSGTAIINGYDIKKNASNVRSNIGIVFQTPSSDDMLTGYENLKIHSLLYNVPASTRKNRIVHVLELVGLTDRKDDLVKKYSGGMRRRLEIARGLLHKPAVLFLDEPTLGLDPSSREIMWKYIKKLIIEEQITIILTTHYMEEADFLCDTIGFIDKGKIILQNSPSTLKKNIKGDIINLQIKENVNQISIITNTIKQLDFVNKVDSFENGKIDIIVNNANRDLPVILNHIQNISNNKNNILSIDFKKPTLNDIFLKYTGRNIDNMTDKDNPEGGFMERYANYAKQ
ncbi:MAG TPA: ATP-binding cassette domain-containing protein [Verrucomicrobiae bacterium]|nr:ATP-binding cassette domain-containing protein [Verrucomicrobiae bacterium]